MTSRGMNRVAQLLAGNCLAGISIGWWKWNHNAHHIACNSLDFDPDLQHIPFFAVSSTLFSSITSCFYDRKLSFDPAARFLVSYQHLTFYPVMCFARINLFAQSFLLLLSKRRVPDRVSMLALLVGTIGLRSKPRGPSTSLAPLGWTGSMVDCSFRLSTICSLVFPDVSFARFRLSFRSFARSTTCHTTLPLSGGQMY
ncbi:Delta(8)-fatty-acid desaturase 1 [Linum grandiflorum]